jgi:hypothetical protein
MTARISTIDLPTPWDKAFWRHTMSDTFVSVDQILQPVPVRAHQGLPATSGHERKSVGEAQNICGNDRTVLYPRTSASRLPVDILSG